MAGGQIKEAGIGSKAEGLLCETVKIPVHQIPLRKYLKDKGSHPFFKAWNKLYHEVVEAIWASREIDQSFRLRNHDPVSPQKDEDKSKILKGIGPAYRAIDLEKVLSDCITAPPGLQK